MVADERVVSGLAMRDDDANSGTVESISAHEEKIMKGTASKGVAARGVAARGVAAKGVAAKGVAARGVAAKGVAA